MSESLPIVATLILKAAGMSMQKITTPKGVLVFEYRRGFGHVREYTDLAKFHREEAALRELRILLNVRTVIGEVGTVTTARRCLKELIADTTGHRGAKHALLSEFRDLLAAEIARLERQGIGREEPESPQETPPGLSARDKAIEERRGFMRRAGEGHVRGMVENYGIAIQKLNNFAGMMDAIIEREFPEGWEPQTASLSPLAEVIADTAAYINARDRPPADDFDTMPIARLREMAKERGIEAPKGQTLSRANLVAALKAPAVAAA